jgi:S-DNA-T family DNA segregation ATPase FtsK/SpoIIIE
MSTGVKSKSKATNSIKKSASGISKVRDGKDKKVTVVNGKSHRQFSAIIVFFAALLFAAITFIPGQHVWLFIHKLFLGTFSICAYLCPVIMIYIAVIAAFDKPVQSIAAKIFEMFGLLFLIDAAIQLFAVGGLPDGGFGALFIGGIALRNGGVAGGIVGAPLFSLFGKTGAAITVILLSLVLVMMLTEVTLAHIIKFLFPEIKRKRKTEDEKLPEEPAPARFKHKKPRYNIDVKLADEAGVQVSEFEAPPTTSPQPKTRKKAGKSEEVSHGVSAADLDELVNKAAQLIAPETADAAAETAASSVTLEKAEKKNTYVPDVTGVQQKLYDYPPVTLLKQETQLPSEDVSEELKSNAARLVDTLRSFGVETRITDICRGPAVTRYELQPSAGVKISRITSLADDIALNLASAGVRIEAPIPNKAAVGIEVPNKNVNIVHIREIIDSDEFRGAGSKLTMALGRDIAGNVKVADVSKMPHMLIAGATGSGKSVCINSIIISLLYKASPDEVKFLMVDPKVVELGVYNGIPHLLVPVVTEPGKAAGALNWAVTEMLGRYKTFADSNVRDIKGYNILAEKSQERSPMPHIVIIIDELSDLMMAAPKDVEEAVCRLAQMARAAGMHLVIATQRPSVDVITGVIKANIPSRIAFAVSSQVDSRTILDMGGAEKLLGRGDMLFLPMGSSKPTRVQGCFVSDAEVESVINYIKKGACADYDENVMDEIEKQAVKEKGAPEENDGDADAMLPQAIECVVEAGMASTSLLQRRLKLGYARAARIVDQMETRGIVGPFEGSKPRQVLITRQQWIEMTMNGKDENNSNSLK